MYLLGYSERYASVHNTQTSERTKRVHVCYVQKRNVSERLHSLMNFISDANAFFLLLHFNYSYLFFQEKDLESKSTLKYGQ